MVVRSTRQPSVARAARFAPRCATYDPSLPNGDFYELEQLIDNAVAPRRLTTASAGVLLGARR